jgi:hypothetical protein
LKPPRARARSLATLGFSAMMSDLDISWWGDEKQRHF